MTQEEFNNTRWGSMMKVRCNPMNMKFEATTEVVVSVNFDQCLIGTVDEDLADTSNLNWWRCENCEIVNEE